MGSKFTIKNKRRIVKLKANSQDYRVEANLQAHPT